MNYKQKIQAVLIKHMAINIEIAPVGTDWRVSFDMSGTPYRILLPILDLEAFRYTPSGRRRSDFFTRRFHQLNIQKRWRLLYLYTKYKLESGTIGLSDFESEFKQFRYTPELEDTYAGPGEIKIAGSNTLYNSIQSGVNSAIEGDMVLVGEGEYNLNDRLHVTDGVTLQCSGMGSTVVKFPITDYSGDIINFNGSTGAAIRDVTIDGESQNIQSGIKGDGPGGRNSVINVEVKNITGQDQYGSGPIAVFFTDQPGNVVKNCNIHDIPGTIGAAIGMYGGPYMIAGNQIDAVGRNGIFGLRFSGTISDNTVTNSGTGSLAGDTGISIELHPGDGEGGPTDAIVEQNNVDSWISVVSGTRCAIRHNIIGHDRADERYCGIEFSGRDMVVSHNTTKDGLHTGIIVERPSQHVSLHNNRVRNAYTEGIAFIGVRPDDPSGFELKDVMVAKNTVRGISDDPPNGVASVPPGTGLDIARGVSNVTVADNSITGNDASGIALYDEPGDSGPDNIFIGDNNLEDNGQGGIGVFGHSQMAGRHIAVDGNTGTDNVQPGQSIPIAYERFDLSINASVDDAAIGTAVEFSIDGLPQNVTHVLWDFGEGVPVTGSVASHSFSTDRWYEVSATVWLITGQAVLVQRDYYPYDPAHV